MRVQFFVSFKVFASNSGRYDHSQKQDRRQVADLILRTIPLHPHDAARLQNGQDCRIDCSAEQFVRFQVARRDAGYINRFRDLNVKLINDQHCDDRDAPLFVAMRG